MIIHGPCGNLVAGHVLDVAVKPFQRALRDIDSQLYVRWNPRKLKGWGCWEIRRLPNEKSAIFMGTHEGAAFYRLQYVEYDLVHHVLDAAFLNYDALRKIKEMDTWGTSGWVDRLESAEEEHRQRQREKAQEALRYAIKQNKTAMRDFYEMARSGIHPAEVVTAAPWGSKRKV